MPQTNTCLLVTSTTYRKDVLNLLCLPEGFEYRFRYRARWVDPGVFRNPSVLKGMKSVVIYFHGSATEQPREFVPIREVEIEDTEILGDILYIRFCTGKFYDHSSRNGSPHPNPKSVAIEKALAAFLRTNEPF